MLTALILTSLAVQAQRPIAAKPEINSCKYLVVNDFTQDPYGIARELRNQGKDRGFLVVSSSKEVPAADSLAVCAMLGSWAAEGFGGTLAVRVIDVTSGAILAEASASATAWWTVSRTVRGGVQKIYAQLKYTGFDEALHRARLVRLYPPRPQLAVTEEQIKEATGGRAVIEGIWTDPENRYRLGIIRAPQDVVGDFVAVILRSNTPIWAPGEVKAEFNATASPSVFTSRYFMFDKQPAGTTFVLDGENLMRASINTPGGQEDVRLLRVWPAAATDALTRSPAVAKAGTGFLVTRSGLLATNWHVVSDSGDVLIAVEN